MSDSVRPHRRQPARLFSFKFSHFFPSFLPVWLPWVLSAVHRLSVVAVFGLLIAVASFVAEPRLSK